ncbi:hypothetical protein WOLCODRAFT_149070 [Wolfiporia cocos MD-104 SS10]|uniref:Uncharacterized protein n=1 Tax=Wolfiporia cocos (strain MD-104) TaxID=742152 RepID=A0A2H3JE70_WOLCO|nr:hypothetical protein WOLCODRAFT_149070 [Wolfiporia cocos MD-104 SS10]
MNKLFTAYRYFTFVLFVICNVVLCAVTAWNLSVALAVQFTTSIQVDAFVITIASVGLLFIFPIMFVDAMRKESVTRQVWFECVWVGFFCLLELGSAGAVTTTISGMQCVTSATDGVIKLGPCTSNMLMLAFTWTNAAALLLYLVTLSVTAMLHQHDDPLVWKSNVLEYSWFTMNASLGDAPRSPTKGTQPGRRSFMIFASRGEQTEFSKRMVANRDIESDKRSSWSTFNSEKRSSRSTFDSEKLAPSDDPYKAEQPAPTEPAPTRVPPRPLQLSAIPGSAAVVPTPKSGRTLSVDKVAPSPAAESPNPAAPKTERKKRTLRLHRPPSLDLSRISSFRQT